MVNHHGDRKSPIPGAILLPNGLFMSDIHWGDPKHVSKSWELILQVGNPINQVIHPKFNSSPLKGLPFHKESRIQPSIFQGLNFWGVLLSVDPAVMKFFFGDISHGIRIHVLMAASVG